MGQEIASSHFSDTDFNEFRNRLRQESALLVKWFEDKQFATQEKLQIGLELETWLVTKDFVPAPDNGVFLERLSDADVVPELSKFNAEINATPQLAEADFLSKIAENLRNTWQRIQATCNDLDLHMLMIGSLPTLRDYMLTLAHMSERDRYQAMNHEIMKLRCGQPINLDIIGRDRLFSTHRDIMLEAAATSLQIHLRPPFAAAERYFNASFFAAIPLVAICANTPYLFGVDLWDETRIPIFEQAVQLPGFHTPDGSLQRRVCFGSGFVRHSLVELFLENLNGYPVLLPFLSEEKREKMTHVRLHNGNIWRWIRPIIGFSATEGPHVRIEQRVPAAGPTVTDVVANIAFYVGLTHFLATQPDPPESLVPFERVRSSFYAAAKFGFAASVDWLYGKQVSLQTLIHDQLIDQARSGLRDLDIDQEEIDYYLDEVILNRVRSGRTGAAWQRSFVATHGCDFQSLTSKYYELQEKGHPVHEWTV